MYEGEGSEARKRGTGEEKRLRERGSEREREKNGIIRNLDIFTIQNITFDQHWDTNAKTRPPII